MKYNFAKLGTLCEFENGDRGRNYPSGKDFVSEGIPFINGGHIFKGEIDEVQLNYITENKYNQLRAGKARKGDILFSLRGSLGKCARNPFEKAAIASALVIVRPKDGIDKEYLFYVMNSPFFVKQGQNNDNGSVQINLSVDILKSFIVPLPALDIQKQVAKTLSVIDKKINNNNAIVAELDNITKEIYDFWFLQFDFPDESGRPYKSSGGKMLWNEQLKREIPTGWEVTKIGSTFKTLLGGTPNTKKSNYWDGDIPWLSSGEVAFSPVLKSEKTITKSGMENSATAFAKAGAVVMSITRYIRPAILGIDACFNQSVVAVIPNDRFHSEYIYPFMLAQVNRFMSLRTGAQQPHINKNILDSTPFLCPTDDIMGKYYALVKPLYRLQLNKARESQTLISLRDFLLPMLINGQVTIKENCADKEKPANEKIHRFDERFALWLQSKGLAARGEIDRQTLREIFDAMDDDDK